MKKSLIVLLVVACLAAVTSADVLEIIQQDSIAGTVVDGLSLGNNIYLAGNRGDSITLWRCNVGDSARTWTYGPGQVVAIDGSIYYDTIVILYRDPATFGFGLLGISNQGVQLWQQEWNDSSLVPSFVPTELLVGFDHGLKMVVGGSGWTGTELLTAGLQLRPFQIPDWTYLAPGQAVQKVVLGRWGGYRLVVPVQMNGHDAVSVKNLTPSGGLLWTSVYQQDSADLWCHEALTMDDEKLVGLFSTNGDFPLGAEDPLLEVFSPDGSPTSSYQYRDLGPGSWRCGCLSSGGIFTAGVTKPVGCEDDDVLLSANDSSCAPIAGITVGNRGYDEAPVFTCQDGQGDFWVFGNAVDQIFRIQVRLNPSGVAEQPGAPSPCLSVPTIMRFGQLPVGVDLLDATGRRVRQTQLQPGVYYFLNQKGGILRRVVIIR